MLYKSVIIAFLNFALVVLLGIVFLTPIVFTGRVLPGVKLGSSSMTGVLFQELPGVTREYTSQLPDHTLVFSIKDTKKTLSLHQLGISVDEIKTAGRIKSLSWLAVLKGYMNIAPVLTLDAKEAQRVLKDEFSSVITLPKDASLRLTDLGFVVIPSQNGQEFDLSPLSQEIAQRVQAAEWSVPINMIILPSAPVIQDAEVAAAKQLAETIMTTGIQLGYKDKSWNMKAFTIKRLIEFVPVSDPQNYSKSILGVTLNREGLVQYLKTTIVPDIDKPAQNARFTRTDIGEITKYAPAQTGESLDIDQTVSKIETQLAAFKPQADLTVTVTEPAFKDLENIQVLNLTLLTKQETSFVGSHANRIFNIKVGTDRFQGLLLPPVAEFSFDQLIGPVDGVHGFKPELVIKQNVTTPEFGGGLCQVSTTAFRAAVYAGLKVTQRRNHAYAVSYYGTPGFDATVYPPYTDLRFINNTPGYILIQARVEDTHVIFEFWGTADGRVVNVVGPTPYDRKSDGSVKATLTQTVTDKDGQELINDTFYSRYKSPKLFPKVAAAEDPPKTAP